MAFKYYAMIKSDRVMTQNYCKQALLKKKNNVSPYLLLQKTCPRRDRQAQLGKLPLFNLADGDFF